MSKAEPAEHRVLIVGAGPAGLALAIELGHRNIPCLVVERNDRVGHAPRAKTTHVRTREHLRRWGIADQLAAASPLGVDYPSDIGFVTRLGGHLLSRFENAFNCAPGKSPLYAEHAQWIPQYALEQVLRQHAQSLPGVDIRFNSRHQGLEQHADRVASRILDTAAQREYTIETDYLVGADGSRSGIREAIGATMQGQGKLSRNYNIIFRAPGLAQAHTHGPCVMYWQVNPEIPSVIGPMDRDDIWYFAPLKLPQDVTYTDEQAVDAIRRATGIDLPYEILSSDEWVASSLIADKYRDRRVFLAGDACHLHPPFGGFGMFLGMLDAIDIGWKMAAVLKDQGGAGLLDTYELERKPVHEYVVAQAVSNHRVLTDAFVRPELEAVGTAGDRVRAEVGAQIQQLKAAEFNSLGVVLGYRYDHSPVVLHDGEEPPPASPTRYVPSTCPGGRAPHAWLADGSALFDHFGPDFTLLATGGRSTELESRVRRDSHQAAVPVSLLVLDEPPVLELYTKRFTLIRPDQHIAWRGDEWPADAQSLLGRVVGRSPADCPLESLAGSGSV